MEFYLSGGTYYPDDDAAACRAFKDVARWLFPDTDIDNSMNTYTQALRELKRKMFDAGKRRAWLKTSQ